MFRVSVGYGIMNILLHFNFGTKATVEITDDISQHIAFHSATKVGYIFHRTKYFFKYFDVNFHSALISLHNRLLINFIKSAAKRVSNLRS